ncbi:P-loop containing nucleoside triphosphate hydrolase protein [Cadophora sp. MPI-SDFR-AT-0126]|nr:P-loop containing nucleoside triphosphate hydrolase protein [Leotiomycetes sp. MPI-SDFR-AT-0126]
MGEVTTTVLGLAEQISQTTSRFIHSSKHRDLLDIVDALRSNGVSHYVDLPQIIVCGSQSSGKSSTLESLSGIAFPTAEGLCTRFATELILRRSEKSEIKVQIQPSASRTEDERVKLLKFHEKESEQKDFAKIIESAKVEMGLTGTGPDAKVFSTDVLRIESTSPTAPNLTLVDLPGLFSASDKNQSEGDVDLVRDLVVSYMKQKRSIILAVVAADSAFANQPVTKFARDIDPSGTRTLGLITKPDKIDRGSDSEKYYIELAQNENVKLSLGWHVLRNKSHATSDDTSTQRDERESSFFTESDWKQALKPSQLGIAKLRDRLREVLWNQINESLPGVKYDVQMGIKDCTSKLHQLGKSRGTAREKHTYLHQISSKVSTMVQAAIDGVYADPFFASYPGQQDAFDRRLRANVQKTLTIYAGKMVLHGHAVEVVEDDQTPMQRTPSKYIMRSDYLEEVKILMAECRGRELPGTFNPLVIADLFSRQCKPWEHITQNLAEQVHEAAAITFNKILSEICDENTRTRLMKGFIQPSLHKLRKNLKEKLDELLEPHLSIHPITYNDSLTETVQKIQGARHDRAFDALSEEGCGYTSEDVATNEDIDLATVINALRLLRDGTRPNVEEYSVSLAADVAAAYYKVALKKFIDDVSVNAVEACLVQNLPKVFCPDVAWELSDEQVEYLGSEDETTVMERAALQKKKEILGKALSDLDEFTVRSGAGKA